MTPRRKKGTSNAVRIIDRMVGGDAALRALIDEEVANAQLAQLIRRARKAAGLTQAQLAAAIGSTQPSIARLEDAEYEGHSLGILRRIATALGQCVEVRLVPSRDR